MNKYIKALLIAATTASYCYADIIDGRYGVNQVFCIGSRNPSMPQPGLPFVLHNLQGPYKDDWTRYNIPAGGYVGVVYTGNSTWPVGLRLYKQDGTIEEISNSGKIYGLEHDGFFYIINSVSTGHGFACAHSTFISNAQGLNYGDSASYITTSGTAASLADLNAYQATDRILGPGEIVLPRINYTLLDIIKAQNNRKAYGVAKLLDFSVDFLDAEVQQAFASIKIDNEATPFANVLPSELAQKVISEALNQLVPIYVINDAMLDVAEEAYYAAKSRNSLQRISIQKELWVEPLYTASSRDDQGTTPGYDMKARGLICGFDTKLSEKILVGSAFSYMAADIKDNRGKDKVDSGIYDIILYGSCAITPQNEISFTSSFANVKSSTSRPITISSLERVATANHGGFAISAGANFMHTANIKRNFNLKLGAGIDYHHFKSDEYTESGAGSLNLKMYSQNMERFIPSVTIGGCYNLSENLSLEAGLGVACNILSGQSNVNAAFIGVDGTDTETTKFTTEGLSQPLLSAKTGIAITYQYNNRINVSLGYNGGVWSGDLSEKTVYFRAGIKI